jgi:glycosyltransferase involved in cell wall biosynthesis
VKDIPLVSVVMPCYNCRQYVGQAISSILEQTYKNLELIIIDDNSTDGSGEIIKRYLRDRDILITHEMNQGISRSLNDGIRILRGRYAKISAKITRSG